MDRFSPRTVLVAFDGTAVSRRAWKHAVALARRFDAALEVVRVEPVPPATNAPPPPPMSPARARAIRAETERFVGAETKIRVLEGDPATCILAAARAARAGLVVTGTHGRHGAARLVLGSVAEDAMRGATVPVLAARGPARPIRSILAPVNFETYSREGLECAAALAEKLGATLTALFVSADPIWDANPKARLRRMLADLPEAVRARCEARVLVSGDPAEGIARASVAHDLIVLVEHDRAPVRHFFFGNTVERVLRRVGKPVLAVPALSSRAGRAARTPPSAR